MKKLLGVVIAFSLLLSACKPSEMRVAQRCQASTVLVHMKISLHVKGEAKDKQGMGTCSGVYVGPHLVLTANHCVDFSEDKDMKLKEIWIGNVYGDSAKASIVKRSPAQDLALLRTTLKGTPVKLASTTTVGEDIWVVGNPLGLEFVVSKGIVSATDVELSEKNLTGHFLTDCVVLPGNSGGPAFTSKGQLLGIVVRSTSVFGAFGASGLGLVVQVDEVRKFLRQR